MKIRYFILQHCIRIEYLTSCLRAPERKVGEIGKHFMMKYDIDVMTN